MAIAILLFRRIWKSVKKHSTASSKVTPCSASLILCSSSEAGYAELSTQIANCFDVPFRFFIGISVTLPSDLFFAYSMGSYQCNSAVRIFLGAPGQCALAHLKNAPFSRGQSLVSHVERVTDGGLGRAIVIQPRFLGTLYIRFLIRQINERCLADSDAIARVSESVSRSGCSIQLGAIAAARILYVVVVIFKRDRQMPRRNHCILNGQIGGLIAPDRKWLLG
jgi:hypothetical protein